MAELVHGEFDLNGYRFGTGHRVYPSHVSRGGIEWTDQDQKNPNGDGILFGRDYRTPKPIEFELTISADTAVEALDAADEFAHAWEYAVDQWQPGQEIPLTWNRHGRTFRVYGRPRALTLDDGELWTLTTVTGQKAEFLPGGNAVYEEPARSISLTTIPGHAGGFIFPVVFPWGTTSGGARQGIITDGGGRRPTHDVKVTIHGPLTGTTTVTGPGWTIALAGAIAYDRSVTVDAQAKTVLWDNGGNAAGMLTGITFLNDITIQPGQSEITFTGSDTTGTATATITWRPQAN